MLVKLPDFDDALAADLQQRTGLRTAAGAVRYVCERHGRLLDHGVEQERQIHNLKTEVRRLQAIIENARASAAALLDKTSQTDLLT